MSDDSIERKDRNERYLKSIGIPINSFLPRIESESEINLRNPQDTARRAIVLLSVVGIAYGANPKRVADWLKAEGIWDWVSPNEMKVFESEKLEGQLLIDASWRSENLYTLLWALNKVNKLELPIKQGDSHAVVKVMPAFGTSCSDFIAQSTLRTKCEILDQTDLIFRIHWAVRDAQLTRKDIPGKFLPGIVVERHYALNWLTCYAEDWDDITTDT